MRTADIAKCYPNNPEDTGYGWAVRENGREIAHGGPVPKDVAIHNCLTLGAKLPRIIPENLTARQIAEALTAGGYPTKVANDLGDQPNEIFSACFVGWCQSGAIYEISYEGEEVDVEFGNVYVTERGGRLVADY